MTIDTKDMLNSILESISRISYIKPEEIPEIDLYMDQVTTFMESHLSSSRRHEGDKILTKTMINNYAKNNLLPPPVKKKYSKEHLLMLTFIYYLKNIFLDSVCTASLIGTFPFIKSMYLFPFPSFFGAFAALMFSIISCICIVNTSPSEIGRASCRERV